MTFLESREGWIAQRLIAADALATTVRGFLDTAHVTRSADLSRAMQSEKPEYRKLIDPAEIEKLRRAVVEYENARLQP